MIMHLEINFFGNLKGLAIMQFAFDRAKKFNLVGYIKRLPTGTLHIEAEGEEENLKKFLKLCESREEWTSKNEVNFSDQMIGYERFYIRKFG
jgi:acylphosphatase